jgi:hypothetical protein
VHKNPNEIRKVPKNSQNAPLADLKSSSSFIVYLYEGSVSIVFIDFITLLALPISTSLALSELLLSLTYIFIFRIKIIKINIKIKKRYFYLFSLIIKIS